MYYVYRFLDKEKNIIYVGKSKQELEQRFRGHLHLPKECYELVHTIEYIECLTETDMSIKEIYYINKYYNENVFFNILDTGDIPTSVEFEEKWKLYKGSLDSQFYNSINYIEGYAFEREIRYNKDGSVDKRKSNSQKGVSTFVEGLSIEEVNLIIDNIIEKINEAATPVRQQVWFRNLLLFVLGVNLPIKANEILLLRYSEVFDENDIPKSYELKLGRYYKDEIVKIPLRNVVKEVLLAYKNYYELSYQKNAKDNLFYSRKSPIVSMRAWSNIIKSIANEIGIEKNVATESLRKTYGLNIYNNAFDKLNALMFLGELWGNVREVNLISYLNLTKAEVDFSYYLGEEFTLGSVDFSKITCLKEPVEIIKNEILEGEDIQRIKNDEVKQPKRKNRIWTKEKKIEVVKKVLEDNISRKDLAEEYDVDVTNISHWVSDYKTYGEDIFENRRKNSKCSKEKKLEIVKKCIEEKYSVREAAIKFSINMETISQWINDYRCYGVGAFEDDK